MPARVLILIDRLHPPGGAEKLAIEQALRLDRGRFLPSVALTRAADPRDGVDEQVARLRGAGIDVIGIRPFGRTRMRPWWVLLRYIRRNGIEILHSHKFATNAYAIALARMSGIRTVIAHEHTWDSGHANRSAYRWIERAWIARGSSRVIAASDDLRRRLIEQAGLPPERVLTVPNGIAPLPTGDSRRVRSELGIGEHAPVVGAVAHLRAEKALDSLLEAAAMVRRGLPALRVVIAGEGPARTSLQGLIRDLGQENAITLLGFRTDIPDVLAALDVAVCCSDYEGGHSLAVLEYMNAGVPVVATGVGALPEVLEGGRCGLIVPPRDPAALANAISRALADADLRRGLVERARKRVDAFGIDGWIASIEQLYEELLQLRPSGSG